MKLKRRRFYFRSTDLANVCLVVSSSLTATVLHFRMKLPIWELPLTLSTKAIRCRRTLFFLLNRRSSLNEKNKILLYKVCIRAGETTKKKLQVVQNKHVKIIHGLRMRHRTVHFHRFYDHQFLATVIETQCRSFESRCRLSSHEHLRILAE